MAFYSLSLKTRNSSKQFRLYTSDFENDRLLRRMLADLTPRIEEYVRRMVGAEVSVYEYVERIFTRLERVFEPHTDPAQIEHRIFLELQSIVHNDRRSIFRAAKRQSTTPFDAHLTKVEDPRGLSFVSRLESRSELRALLGHLPPAAKALLLDIHVSQKDRGFLAKLRGCRKNSIDQENRRLLDKVRESALNEVLDYSRELIANCHGPMETWESESLRELRELIACVEATKETDKAAALRTSRKLFKSAREFDRANKTRETRLRPTETRQTDTNEE